MFNLFEKEIKLKHKLKEVPSGSWWMILLYLGFNTTFRAGGFTAAKGNRS